MSNSRNAPRQVVAAGRRHHSVDSPLVAFDSDSEVDDQAAVATYQESFWDSVRYFQELGEQSQERGPSHHGTQSYYSEFFREERRLGSGAFGSVYLVSHVVASHVLGKYAVKKTPIDIRRINSVLQEVRALQMIPRHKNIIGYFHCWTERNVQLADFGPPMPCLFVLQEYARGGSVEDLVTTSQLSDADIWNFLVDLLAGLSHLHRHGFVHRDIKPSNLLLQPRSVQGPPSEAPLNERLFLLISDLGSAGVTVDIAADHNDPCQQMTLEYIAPELLFDGTHTAVSSIKTDAWAAGLVLFYMMYGRLPWWTANHNEFSSEETLNRIRSVVNDLRQGAFVFPSFPVRPTLMKDYVLKLLRPDPSHRFTCNGLLQSEFLKSIKRMRCSVPHTEVIVRPAVPHVRPPRPAAHGTLRDELHYEVPGPKAPIHHRVGLPSQSLLLVLVLCLHVVSVLFSGPLTDLSSRALATLEILCHILASWYIPYLDTKTWLRGGVLFSSVICLAATAWLQHCSLPFIFVRLTLLLATASMTLAAGSVQSSFFAKTGTGRMASKLKQEPPGENHGLLPLKKLVRN